VSSGLFIYKPINKKAMKKAILMSLLSLFVTITSFGQITTSALSGVVKNEKGDALVGASVEAVHQPTGSMYRATTNKSGLYTIPAVRPGGPYVVKVSFVGYKTEQLSDINTQLGISSTINVVLIDEVKSLKEVVISANRNNTFSKDRTGASQQFGRRELTSVPITGARTIDGITKYNPMGDGRSFGAADSRLNNFTIDGSQFNNGFGLGSSAQAGGRTGSTAISLDAIDQLQINVAPFDIRQSGFVGAGINATTRSGTNKIEGSYYQSSRDNVRYVGNNAKGTTVTASKFEESVRGFRLGAPIIKNKLFIFGNFESLEKTEPGTTWISTGSPLTGSQVSRVTYSDMKTLSDFMRTKFNYETGAWEGYNNANTSKKFLVRADWNINDKHKLTARYVHHNSDAEINISNSQSAGAGNRTTQFNAMSFKNSGYIIMDNTRSAVLELNSKFSNSLHNNLIVGYDKQIEDRAYLSNMFPTIDIMNGSATYTSVGFDPFTPDNKLDYNTFHITNNLTKFLDKHTIVGGVNFEKYRSNNLFYPASNGVYIFNSLADFYTAAGQSLANGGRPSTLAPARFQLRYSALPGGVAPMQVLKTSRLDLYLQDEYQYKPNLKLTGGLRVAVIGFENTALENKAVTAMSFAGGEKFNTAVLPNTQVLFEPRFGFNYNHKGESKTQVRGGTGIFTGRPPYVFVSNQVGNNGVLTGFIDVSGAAAANYGFTANPNQYFIPSTPTLPSTFDLAFTDPNYKFPQVWKTNLAVDQKLPLGFVGTVELLYNRFLNAVHYYNANLDLPVGKFTGVDQRPVFARTDAGVRVNDNVSMGAVLTNKNGAYFRSATFELKYPAQKGLWGSFAWSTSLAKDYMSAGSIASGSWQSARAINGNNDLPLSFSDNWLPNRMVGLLGYKIENGAKKGAGATTITLGYVGQQGNPFSYFVAGDLNGDRVNNNELIFVPNKGSDIKFAPLVVGTRTYTEAEQQAAFDDYISQDKYLSTRRGQYAERNASTIPMLHRFDLSVQQDFVVKVKGVNNSLQIRIDILNFGNMVNKDWGVSQRATNPAILSYSSTNTAGEPVYKLSTQKNLDGTTTLIKDTYQWNSSVFDVWTAQLGLRYTFGN
jgi:Carboxypeptidase regulatory-like domain